MSEPVDLTSAAPAPAPTPTPVSAPAQAPVGRTRAIASVPSPGRRAVPSLQALLPPGGDAAATEPPPATGRQITGVDVLLVEPDRGKATPDEDFAGRDLSAFTGAGYDKGRSLLWQAAWFATMNLIFSKWWLPARFRPAILRAFGARVGERVLIRHRVRVQWPWKLTIGDDCWIGEGVWLMNLEQITLEDDVCLSQESLLCTGSHARHDPAFEFDNAPIVVRHGAWVAARATVLRGSTVEVGEVVGAHGVRTRRGGERRRRP